MSRSVSIVSVRPTSTISIPAFHTQRQEVGVYLGPFGTIVATMILPKARLAKVAMSEKLHKPHLSKSGIGNPANRGLNHWNRVVGKFLYKYGQEPYPKLP